MAVKMRKWSPWPPPRKFQVSLKPLQLQLQGFPEDRDGIDMEMTTHHKFIAIKIKWKGQPKLFPPFQPRPKKQISGPRVFKIGQGQGGIVLWDEDRWFENTCCFSLASNHHHNPKFGPWEVAFSLLYGGKMDSEAKMAVIGTVSINISEFICKIDNSFVEQKLPLNLRIDGCARDATLTVLFNFVEIRDTLGSVPIPLGGSTACSKVKVSPDSEHKKNAKARRRSLSHEEESLDEVVQLVGNDAALNNLSTKSIKLPAVLGLAQDSDKKEGWFSWRNRHFSFKRPRNKEENLDEKTVCCSNEEKIVVDPQSNASSSVESSTDPAASQIDDQAKPCSGSAGVWEKKELISRDGEARLKAPVFFASFDQCSDKAAGESACTVLVAMISHWLHSHRDGMPSLSELDNLIMQGSAEWRKLCEDASYVNEFPDKHFDLETVLRADVGPISIAHHKSFVGFFGADTFESLKGFMSFDDIWNEISSNGSAAARIYIASWNDHFFVLKAEEKAYYIIDTLGERLFEGCNQAFILRFDDEAEMQKHNVKKMARSGSESVDEEETEILCSGKECCREYIKRFLAAIPLKELEEEEKEKKEKEEEASASYFSHQQLQRLQIEFNYSCLSSCSALSSLTSSPFLP